MTLRISGTFSKGKVPSSAGQALVPASPPAGNQSLAGMAGTTSA
jgi:hypothetical protein